MTTDSPGLSNERPIPEPDAEAWRKALFSHTPQALQIWRADGACVAGNHAFETLFAPWLADNRAQLMSHLSAHPLLASARVRLFAGESVAAECITFDPPSPAARERSAGPLAVECAFFPLPSADGVVRHIGCAYRDVSLERARAEEARVSPRAPSVDERLRVVLENAPVALFALDSEGRYTCVEGQRLRSLGFRAEDFLGRSAFDVAREDTSTAIALRRCLAGESLTFRSNNSASGKFECRLVPDLGEDGATRGIIGVSYDITPQFEAEQALRRSEQNLRFALESGRLVEVEVDLTTRAMAVSRNAMDIFGAPPEHLDSVSAWLAIMHPDDVELAEQSLAQALAYGQPLPDIEYRIIRPDTGDTVWCERRLRVLRDEVGKAIGLHGFFFDISQRKRAEEVSARSAELHLQNRRIQEASRLKNEFLANMSHELRTPLNAIIGFAELLYDGQVSAQSPRYREFLGEILAGGHHLLQLINDVLDLAKVESGKQEFWPEPVQLHAMVHEICLMLRNTAAQKRIRIVLELLPEPSEVVVDVRRLKQVLFNFLSNAIKFTPEGGRVVVRTSLVGEDDFFLEVEDNGVGIAPADLGRLFNEFQQLHTGLGKKQQGTGLGLVLTRRLVEAQGGSVSVRSSVGVGSSFKARLPRAPRGAHDSSVQGSPSTSPPAGVPTILVVEDNERERQVLERALRDAGYEVEPASTGAAAIALCQQRRFHAVTLDLFLPDMSGLDVLAGIRATGKNRDAPVVVVSVAADPSALSSYVVHDVLQKPLNTAHLLDSLHRALNTNAARALGPDERKSVLVVDDDPGALRLMENVLEQLGYAPICRASGALGLSVAAAQNMLAIVLDLLMPEMDGFAFLERLRAIPAHQHTPVIVWTTKDLTAHDVERLRQSAHGVIGKSARQPGRLTADLEAILKACR